MIGLKPLKIWFVCGSQHLYGPETLAQVDAQFTEIAAALSKDGKLPLEIVPQPVIKSPTEATELAVRANADPECGLPHLAACRPLSDAHCFRRGGVITSAL